MLHYRRDQNKDVPLGVIGSESFETVYDDQVVIQVELDQPAHCFLIACNFDGKDQLLWPCDEQRFPFPGDPRRAPPAVDRVVYPPFQPERQGGPNKMRGLALNDDPKGGMQAFLVVVSQQPLPTYQEWLRQRGAMPWWRMPAERVVWWSDGKTQEQRTPRGGQVRGGVVELQGQAPLLQLCEWARGTEAEVVEAVTFPVYPRGGN